MKVKAGKSKNPDAQSIEHVQEEYNFFWKTMHHFSFSYYRSLLLPIINSGLLSDDDRGTCCNIEALGYFASEHSNSMQKIQKHLLLLSSINIDSKCYAKHYHSMRAI